MQGEGYFTPLGPCCLGCRSALAAFKALRLERPRSRKQRKMHAELLELRLTTFTARFLKHAVKRCRRTDVHPKIDDCKKPLEWLPTIKNESYEIDKETVSLSLALGCDLATGLLSG